MYQASKKKQGKSFAIFMSHKILGEEKVFYLSSETFCIFHLEATIPTFFGEKLALKNPTDKHLQVISESMY